MTASVYRLVTANTTNLNKVRSNAGVIKGFVFTNTNATYAIFVKLYWFRPTATAAVPTVGTTLPSLTVGLPAVTATTGGGTIAASFPDGFTGGAGDLYIAVTKLVADTDTTAVGAGDGLLSLLVEPS